MPPQGRDSPLEGQRRLRHQHSASSDHGGRALVPMWDSSDPERAPPPLPLNPQSPSISSRAGTSSAIQSAHAALNERARESAAVLPPVTRRVHDQSPERAVVKGGSHRRTQTLQPGSVRDLSLMLEGATNNSPNASPTRSPDRSGRSSTATPTATQPKDCDKEWDRDTPASITNSEQNDRTPTSTGPMPGSSWTPILRPTARRAPPQSILGENTPPQSSTMLALQSMGSQSSRADSEPPLSNVTNGSTAVARQPQQPIDQLSSQILSLTNIATSLQKEMSALSRRSRDNATDLLSLKEATNTRDEDIRKSLRDLLGSVNDTSQRLSSAEMGQRLYLDNKPHNVTSPKPFQLPRIPSPKSFTDSFDRGSMSTPSLVGGDGFAAPIPLLEKILRDMGTKEGQDALIGGLSEVSRQLAGLASGAKVDELLDFVRSQAQSAAIIPSASRTAGRAMSGDYELTQARAVPSAASAKGSEILNEDLIKVIRSVKDSIAQGGGLTAEVKALVRELRGEVLGMGRELGKRLETVGQRNLDDTDHASKDDVSRVIDEGLEQMKDQLNHVLREHRRQSAQSAATSKSLVDYQEIYNAMRAALRDNEASRGEMPDLSRDDVIDAVRDAWETYKPEIEVQQLGLERDEILACLQEGLQEYAHRDGTPAGATRDEVFQAVVEGLKHFVPPQMDTSASISRDEIVEAVRDCLEEFEFPVAASAVGVGGDLSREDMVHAVREGLSGLDIPRSRSLGDGGPASNSDEIIGRLEDLLGYMKLEFKSVSQEAKDNVAANGRDTEQVLDATKDGFENLRIAIESYVDRATGEAGQEEFMQGLLRTMDDFKDEIGDLVSQSTDYSREQLHKELENLREVVNSSMVLANGQPSGAGNSQEILEALQNVSNGLRQDILRPRAETAEILDTLNEGLSELRLGIERMTNKPVDMTANDEILEALKAGLDSVRSDIESIREGSNDRAVAAVPSGAGPEHAIIPADMAKQDDIKNLEVLITQLRIKIEAMEPGTDSVQKDDLSRLETVLESVRQGVEDIGAREVPQATSRDAPASDSTRANGDAASREDFEAIEMILHNTKARLDELMDGDQAIRKDHLDTVEALILETRESMAAMVGQMDGISRRDDLDALESLVTQIKLDFDEMKEKSQDRDEDEERVSKTDVAAVETVVLEIKDSLDVLQGVNFDNIPQKEDLASIETMLKEAKEKFESRNEVSTTAAVTKEEELRKVDERVSEVKTFLEELQDTLKSKLDDGSTGIEALGKLLETIGEKVDKNENVGTDLQEMLETMKSEFEDSRGVVAGAKLESDEKLQLATESIGTKIDEKISELIDKYDEFQMSFDEKARAGEARDAEAEAAVMGTKAVADELKLLIDTLGSTVTDSLERMEEASRTVFSKVEELVTRSDENQVEGRAEHQQTRDQLEAAVHMVESLRGEVTESNPKILDAIQEVLALVGQHYEHSKSSTTDIQDKIVETRPTDQAMLPAPEKYDDTEVREKLDRLTELKYDDSSVNEKLDRLVTHSSSTEQALSHLETLDKVHESVIKTASEISTFLEMQNQRVTDDTADRERTLEETTASIERSRIEKDHLEASILSLKDEEERVRNSVTSLRTEQESLIRQKTRLTGDVSALETAMRLRKEALAEMETRADRLERRIFEGVMDHSRVLLMSRSTKGGGGAGESMNRRRVKKNVVQQDTATPMKPSPKPAMNMALSGKRSLAPPGQTGSAERRIASLGQINSNVSSGGFKRSQSVRTPAGGARSLRKRSWGGDVGHSDTNKENLSVRETVEEVDENESPALIGQGDDDTSIVDDGASDTGTLRRSSLASEQVTCDGSEYSDMTSEWTESAVGSSVMAGVDASSVGDESNNGMVLYGS